MPVQFLLHLKGTAIDWYQENEEYFKRANWIEVETGFVERFKRSDAASAMDLQRIKIMRTYKHSLRDSAESRPDSLEPQRE